MSGLPERDLLAIRVPGRPIPISATESFEVEIRIPPPRCTRCGRTIEGEGYLVDPVRGEPPVEGGVVQDGPIWTTWKVACPPCGRASKEGVG